MQKLGHLIASMCPYARLFSEITKASEKLQLNLKKDLFGASTLTVIIVLLVSHICRECVSC